MKNLNKEVYGRLDDVVYRKYDSTDWEFDTELIKRMFKIANSIDIVINPIVMFSKYSASPIKI